MLLIIFFVCVNQNADAYPVCKKCMNVGGKIPDYQVSYLIEIMCTAEVGIYVYFLGVMC